MVEPYYNDSRVTQLSYGTGRSGSSDVGTLTYTYDADGRVMAKGGTLAGTGLPSSVAGNSFNADDAVTAFDGQTLTYDANGNLTNDGTNTYTWDARNHLSAIDSGSTASFVYDAFGRRASKNISGTTTQFLYDGWNPIQELDGATPANITANLLTGLALDERFTRTDSSGTANFLTDSLGNVIALANSSGSIATSYTYQPFGATTFGGSASGNSYQFIGRENDGTGIDYYRARYYSPATQRFISQDPLDIRESETNLYAYVLNDPLNLADPSGRQEVIIPPPEGPIVLPPESPVVEPPGTDLDPLQPPGSCSSPNKNPELEKCLSAAAGSNWSGFCGSLQNKQQQAQCYSEEFQSQTHKEGWCHRNWPSEDWTNMI